MADIVKICFLKNNNVFFPCMKKKVHYIYKITLLCGSLNGKYYLGKHTTDNFKDGYAGSGTILKDYFQKYGKKKNITYRKEIIEFNNSAESNAEREKIIIGDLWKTDPDCINCCEGGVTGVSTLPAWNKGLKGCYSQETKQKMSAAKIGKDPWNKGKTGIYSEETLKKISEAGKGRVVSEETRKKHSEKSKGHKLSLESRKKISDKAKGRKWSEESKIKKMTPIIQLSLDGEYIKDWNGATEVENTIGISHKQIWKCLKGYRKQVGGYVWKYKEAS